MGDRECRDLVRKLQKTPKKSKKIEKGIVNVLKRFIIDFFYLLKCKPISELS